MRSDDERPHLLLRRAGLGFAYVAFGFAVLAIGSALYLLPLAPKVKLFLAAAGALLVSLFAFMAIATHAVMRAERRSGKPRSDTDA